MKVQENLLNEEGNVCSFSKDDLSNVCSFRESDTCGVSSIAVKGTEVNGEKWLEIKHFRVFGQPSGGCLDTQFFAFGEHINRHFSRSS